MIMSSSNSSGFSLLLHPTSRSALARLFLRIKSPHSPRSAFHLPRNPAGYEKSHAFPLPLRPHPDQYNQLSAHVIGMTAIAEQ
jgi:hypothetical protein